MSADPLSLRRRRVLYRATHRGSKEMDLLLGRYVEQSMEQMSGAEFDVLEDLVEAPDPVLSDCIYEGRSLGNAAFDELIGKIRRFHGFRDGG